MGPRLTRLCTRLGTVLGTVIRPELTLTFAWIRRYCEGSIMKLDPDEKALLDSVERVSGSRPPATTSPEFASSQGNSSVWTCRQQL